MKIIGVIPARYNSTRFPGKPLAKILGKPMIWWVYNKVKDIVEFDEVYVATENLEIRNYCIKNNIKVIMTSDKHNTGTDRMAEVAEKIEGDLFVNIQGDEPLINPEMIKKLLHSFDNSEVYCGTLKKKIENISEINNPNVVKVITDNEDFAIYFSRSKIPYNRNGAKDEKIYKHIGLYAYKKDFLLKFTRLEQTSLELMESLEQLRIIENGYKIKVVETEYETIGVDTPEDIKTIEMQMERCKCR